MSTRSGLAGLGIEFSHERVRNGYVSQSRPRSLSRSLSTPDLRGFDHPFTTSGSTMPSRMHPGDSHTMRSCKGMEGLLLAEMGHSMVEFGTPQANGSSFKQGQRIAPGIVTPGGSTRLARPPLRRNPLSEPALKRSGTLLSSGSGITPTRNAAELKSLLGNSNARLKSGAVALPPPGTLSGLGKKPAGKNALGQISLEQANSRARVELDIMLGTDICIEGGYLWGEVEVRVREKTGKEGPVQIAEGKIRLIGFEGIPSESNQFVFYQCSAPLSEATDSLQELFISFPDPDGFAEAREGTHVLPFSMKLPVDSPCVSGKPKGILNSSGHIVRYIAMISIKIKDPYVDKHSIAHFYRNCEVWPSLDPSVVLAPAPRPLQATLSKKLFMGGSGKLHLTVCIHRFAWIAGQQCYVRLGVINETKKTVKSVTLALLRTQTAFKADPALDVAFTLRDGEDDGDPDACRTSTTSKVVEESTLVMGQHGSKGRVSARGWWPGVRTGEQLRFSHSLMIPTDALSIPRGRLLEIGYAVRITLGTGSLTDIHVTIPIRIINFLSIDPPPGPPLHHLRDRTGRERLLAVDEEEEPGQEDGCHPIGLGINGFPKSYDKRMQRPLSAPGYSVASRLPPTRPLRHDKNISMSEEEEFAGLHNRMAKHLDDEAKDDDEEDESPLMDTRGSAFLNADIDSDGEVDFVAGSMRLDRRSVVPGSLVQERDDRSWLPAESFPAAPAPARFLRTADAHTITASGQDQVSANLKHNHRTAPGNMVIPRSFSELNLSPGALGKQTNKDWNRGGKESGGRANTRRRGASPDVTVGAGVVRMSFAARVQGKLAERVVTERVREKGTRNPTHQARDEITRTGASNSRPKPRGPVSAPSASTSPIRKNDISSKREQKRELEPRAEQSAAQQTSSGFCHLPRPPSMSNLRDAPAVAAVPATALVRPLIEPPKASTVARLHITPLKATDTGPSRVTAVQKKIAELENRVKAERLMS